METSKNDFLKILFVFNFLLSYSRPCCFRNGFPREAIFSPASIIPKMFRSSLTRFSHRCLGCPIRRILTHCDNLHGLVLCSPIRNRPVILSSDEWGNYRCSMFFVEKCLKNLDDVNNFLDYQSLLRNDKVNYGDRKCKSSKEKFLIIIKIMRRSEYIYLSSLKYLYF